MYSLFSFLLFFSFFFCVLFLFGLKVVTGPLEKLSKFAGHVISISEKLINIGEDQGGLLDFDAALEAVFAGASDAVQKGVRIVVSVHTHLH